jgi:hypothetical protein
MDIGLRPYKACIKSMKLQNTVMSDQDFNVYDSHMNYMLWCQSDSDD